MLRLTAEFGAQVFALRGYAGWTGVEVALARHIAAQRHQSRRAKAKFLRAQHGRHDHVPPRFKAAIDAHFHTPAQPVAHEHLLRLGKPDLPRHAGVLDRLYGRCARAAIVSADKHVVGMGLSHASRYGSYTDSRDQLDAYARPRVYLVQVVDQLGKVLDAINVVMRGRRDQ